MEEDKDILKTVETLTKENDELREKLEEIQKKEKEAIEKEEFEAKVKEEVEKRLKEMKEKEEEKKEEEEKVETKEEEKPEPKGEVAEASIEKKVQEKEIFEEDRKGNLTMTEEYWQEWDNSIRNLDWIDSKVKWTANKIEGN